MIRRWLLDTSALLALRDDENGAERLAGLLQAACAAAPVTGSPPAPLFEGVATGRKGFHDDVPKEDVVIEKAVAL